MSEVDILIDFNSRLKDLQNTIQPQTAKELLSWLDSGALLKLKDGLIQHLKSVKPAPIATPIAYLISVQNQGGKVITMEADYNASVAAAKAYLKEVLSLGEAIQHLWLPKDDESQVEMEDDTSLIQPWLDAGKPVLQLTLN